MGCFFNCTLELLYPYVPTTSFRLMALQNRVIFNFVLRQVILILFNTDLNTENNISFVKTILKTLLITVNFAHIFRGGTLSRIPLRPVLISI